MTSFLPGLLRRLSDTTVEIVGLARRKTSTAHHEANALIERSKGVEACAPFLFAQLRPREDKTILPAGRLFDDREIFARFPRNRCGQSRNAFLVHKAPQQLSERAAGRIDGSDVGAQPLQDASHIDATSSGVAAGCEPLLTLNCSAGL